LPAEVVFKYISVGKWEIPHLIQKYMLIFRPVMYVKLTNQNMKHILLKLHLALFAPVLIAGSLNAQCTASTPSASNTTVNCGSSATLTATGAVGYQWWDQSSGGNLLASTATYTSPALITNTSYFVNGTDVSPEALMALPAHNTPFNGNVRGYYFTAPIDFTITGLKIPVEVSGLQNIAVVRLAAVPPLYSTVTNAFTQLFLTQNDPTTGIIPVNIQVTAGDIIGILGEAGANNSYSTGATNFATTIGGQPVTLARLGMQYPLGTNAPHDLWTEASGSISRVEMYYTVSCASSRVQVDVAIAPLPVSATAVSSNICDGASTTLNASGATTYTWMPGNLTGASISVSPSATTTYTVTGDDPNTCSNTATVTVTVNPIPTIAATPATPDICTGSSDVLTASGGSTYVWSSGGTNASETVSPTSMTTYTVTGTDINGCSSTGTVMVMVNPLPTVVATANSGSICPGASDVLNGSGAANYLWSSGGTAPTETVTPTTSSTYTLTGTDRNGCVNTATVSVTVNPLPTVVANSTAAAVCDGSSVTLTGSGAISYTWDNSVTDGVAFMPASSLNYIVMGTDANGCMNSDTIMVTVNANPIVDLGNDVTQCGGSVTLDAQNQGATYVWNTSATTQTISTSASGTFYVDVMDGNGCTASDTAMITINTPPMVNGSATSTTACLSDPTITLTGTPAGGTWSGPGVTTSTFSPSSAGVGAQTTTYSFTDANGCSGTANVVITVSACVGVAEQTFENGINIYPNPNNGTFTVAVDANIGDLVIVITDVQGRVVYSSSENNVQSGFAKQISLETASAGLYLMHITANGQQRTEKISVEK
jgi:hypothetical protein